MGLRIHHHNNSKINTRRKIQLQQRTRGFRSRLRLSTTKLILMITIAIGLILYFKLLYSTLTQWSQQQQQADDVTTADISTSSSIRNSNNNNNATITSTFQKKSKYDKNSNVVTSMELQRQSIHHKKKDPNQNIIIGIASTITNCGNDPFIEGAAVLKYSIDDMTSFRKQKGKYDYKFYIFYHPDASKCVLPLRQLGFVLLERPTPINVSDIQGPILKERIINNGCCGERELIKLEAYKLIEHKVVIHLDLDVLVLQPMDPIIDLMINPTNFLSSSSSYNNSSSTTTNTQQQQQHQQVLPTIMWPNNNININNQLLSTEDDEIQLLFTKDYNVVAPKRKDKPFQGGFFVIKPSIQTYEEFIQIVLTGDYRDDKNKKGWGGIVGPFYGGMTIQGLLPWYYEYLHPGKAIELNRCTYNNIADNPTTEKSINDEAVGKCRTNEVKCEDCRKRDISEIVVFHFPICLKPWTCVPQKRDVIEMRLCRKAHHEWFKRRSELEKSWGRPGMGPATFDRDHFLGYCNSTWSKGYIPIGQPYGKPVIES